MSTRRAALQKVNAHPSYRFPRCCRSNSLIVSTSPWPSPPCCSCSATRGDHNHSLRSLPLHPLRGVEGTQERGKEFTLLSAVLLMKGHVSLSPVRCTDRT